VVNTTRKKIIADLTGLASRKRAMAGDCGSGAGVDSIRSKKPKPEIHIKTLKDPARQLHAVSALAIMF
jgi:hypothetical protein